MIQNKISPHYSQFLLLSVRKEQNTCILTHHQFANEAPLYLNTILLFVIPLNFLFVGQCFVHHELENLDPPFQHLNIWSYGK